VLLKGIGPVVLGGRELPGPVLRVVALVAPTLLAALVATQVFGGDRELVLDARVLGLCAAAIGIAARLPVLAVVVLAAVVTAVARLLA
jgi:branched-subunit amino acid transport protein